MSMGSPGLDIGGFTFQTPPRYWPDYIDRYNIGECVTLRNYNDTGFERGP